MFIVRVGFITRIMNFYLAELKNTEVFLESLRMVIHLSYSQENSDYFIYNFFFFSSPETM